MDKKVSVIIPMYNCKKYVGKCIQSVLDQTYENLEIIVVDDGSTDGSGVICDEYAKKTTNIRVIHQENKGLGETRNVGVSYSTGDYITYLDSDDYLSPKCIKEVVEIAEKYKVDMVEFGKVFMLASKNIFINCDNKTEVFLNKEEIKKNRSGMRDTAWGRLYTKQLVDKVSFPKIRLYEDVVYANDIFKHCNSMVKYNHCFYAYRAYQESLTRKSVSPSEIKKEYLDYREKSKLSAEDERMILAKQYILSSKKKIEEIMYRGEEIISSVQISTYKDIVSKLKTQDFLNGCAELKEFEARVENAFDKSKANCFKKGYMHLRHIVNRLMGYIKTKFNYEYKF